MQARLCKQGHDGDELGEAGHKFNVGGLDGMGGNEVEAEVDAWIRQLAYGHFAPRVLLHRQVRLPQGLLLITHPIKKLTNAISSKGVIMRQDLCMGPITELRISGHPHGQ